MLFNSFEFAVFYVLIMIAYWGPLRRTIRGQNILLFITSYIFYGWWDYRFLSLLTLSSAIDYVGGWLLEKEERPLRRKLYLAVSMCGNLGMLCFFKYYNFFAESAAVALESIGFQVNPGTLQVILPVGISFYTFQTMTYTIDIYRRELHAVKDPIQFMTYVAFFPQLVAGPIERAIDLLPQFSKPRTLDWARAQDGLRLMLWGLVKKIVVADNVAVHVDAIFNNYAQLDGVTLVMGAFLFAIQIYGDFSGYTDIARGSAKLLGFELKKNFDFPYFSRNIAEFWRRWHISLSNWFRDYLYIPIGGSRCGKRRTIINILVTFTLCGLWHGANWTFVAWGFLNGLLFIPLILMNKHQVPEKVVAHGRLFPSLREVVAMGMTFVMVLAGWVFFRALNMSMALGYLKTVVTTPYLGLDYTPYFLPLSISLAMLAVEWLQRHQEHGLANLRMPMIARYVMYYGLVIALVELGGRHDVPFIYFQF